MLKMHYFTNPKISPIFDSNYETSQLARCSSVGGYLSYFYSVSLCQQSEATRGISFQLWIAYSNLRAGTPTQYESD